MSLRPNRASFLARMRRKSVWILRLNCGSCGGCDVELESAFGPRYDAAQYGLSMTGSPKHADLVVITGPVTAAMVEPLRRTIEQVPQPSATVALGSCAVGGALFEESYAVAGAVGDIVPVHVSIGGCPPRPRAIVEGLLRAAALLEDPTRLLLRTATGEKPANGEE